MSDEQFNPNPNQNLEMPLALFTSVIYFHIGFFLLLYLMGFVFVLSAAFCFL